MSRTFSRGDRYVAVDVVDGEKIYWTNSAKGMRDKLVILLVNARRYEDGLTVHDTVKNTYATYVADNILDWRI